MNLKENCAKEALKYIADEMIVGLGGGSTIGYLIDYIVDEGLDIKAVTPSEKTRQHCIEAGLPLLDTRYVDYIDVAFDGCDEVDLKLNALKSGGGIHTQEKIIGKMANEYILLVDESKVSDELVFDHPIVLEVVPQAYASVVKQIQQLGGTASLRKTDNKDGDLLSDQGMLLMDVYFDEVMDIASLNRDLIKIVGVLETSLFVDVATKAIVVKEDGFDLIEK